MAESSLSCQERQEYELQALQSIYIDSVEDLRIPSKWNIWQPNKVKLQLCPQESGPATPVYAKLDMIVSCSARYPYDVPTIELQNSKNLPFKKVYELKEELEGIAMEMVGTEMINDLAQKVREFLALHNNPPASSLHEQMVNRNKKEEEERARKVRQQQEKQQEDREKEDRKAQEMARSLLEQEAKYKQQQKAFKKGVTPPPIDHTTAWPHTMTPSLSNLSPIVGSPPAANSSKKQQRCTSTPYRHSVSDADDLEELDKGAGSWLIVFTRGQVERRILCDKLPLKQSRGGSTVYCGEDQATRDKVAVVEWVFQWRKVTKKAHKAADLDDEDPEVAEYLKEVKKVEQEALSTMRLSHINIVGCLGFRYQKEPGKITVHILSEYCKGPSLGENLQNHTPVDLSTLHHYTRGMLNGLHHLHAHDVVHKLFRASCVFVEHGQIQLAGYAFDKRLRELYRRIVKTKVKFEDSTDRMPAAFGVGRSGKREDIYQLAITVLSLSKGDYVTELDRTGLPQTMGDFLEKCLQMDDGMKLATEHLLEHPFVKDPLPLVLHPASPSKQGHEDGGDSRDEEDVIEYRTSMERSGKSRLTQEFHLEKTLGKGGFGDVLKVRNKLDGQVYAIKRVIINPRSRQLEKITREVTSLSRLNHENIVRYYYAWIEFTDDPALSETSSGSLTSSQPTLSSLPKQSAPVPIIKVNKSLDMFDDIEQQAPKAAGDSADWSHSWTTNMASSSSDDDDDDNGFWPNEKTFLDCTDVTEDSIDFEGDDDTPSSSGGHHGAQSDPQCGTGKKSALDSSSVEGAKVNLPQEQEEPPRLRCLYIQMQFCRSTLRRAIDEGLCTNMERVWRYLREITEGLVYIHEQGMIHRDLKPVNIFLDSNDLVKIGDFGLATTEVVKQKTGLADSTLTACAVADPFTSSRSGLSSGEGDMTGEVGTLLYVSPEMMKGGSKLRYGQKVDIYSLGIIFFEMVYRCLSTGMERHLVLSNLRKEEIRFPKDFDEEGELKSQAVLLRQMLAHDPSQRPSSRDLLMSPHMPAVKEVEAEFHRKVEEALHNPDSSSFHRIMSQLFSRRYDWAMAKTYIMQQAKVHNVDKLLLTDVVKKRLEQVFHCHGAVQLNTPQLQPQAYQYSNIWDKLPYLLDKHGTIISLPIDLTLPFARYVGHHSITDLKRFSIEPVYRQLPMPGMPPKQIIECAFDIVTSARKSVIPDALLMVVVEQIINKFPVLKARQYVVCMNHCKLVRAVFLHAGVPEDKLYDVVLTLIDRHMPITVDSLQACMKKHEIIMGTDTVTQLLGWLEVQGELKVVSDRFIPLCRQRGSHVAKMATEGLNELQNIQSTALALGLKMKMLVSSRLQHNFRLYNCGFLFHVYYTKLHKTQKKATPEVIARGGRYDNLVSEFSSSSSPLEVRVVGVGIAFDTLLAAIQNETELQTPSACDVMICCLGYKFLEAEVLQISRNLLAVGVRTEVQYDRLQTMEELQERCQGIPFVVILKDSRESAGFVRIKMSDNTEKKVPIKDVVDFILQKLPSTRPDWDPLEMKGCVCGGGGGGGVGNGGRYNEPEMSPKPASGPSFTFIYTSKLSGQVKRRVETSVSNKTRKWLTGDTDVLVVDLQEQAIRTIQAYIELDKEQSDFDRSVADISEKLSRHRKYLVIVMDHIREIRFEKRKQHMVLYGTKDDTFRLLM